MLNKVLYDNNTANTYNPIKNQVDIIATDGNWSYHKAIKCNYRKIVKIKKNSNSKPIKDSNNKVIKTIIKKEYTQNNKSKYTIDCNQHIVDKAETCCVECKWSSLRGRIPRFIRRTKCYAKSFLSILNGVNIWVNRDFYLDNVRRYSITI